MQDHGIHAVVQYIIYGVFNYIYVYTHYTVETMACSYYVALSLLKFWNSCGTFPRHFDPDPKNEISDLDFHQLS